MLNKRLYVVLAVVVALSMVVVGCGGGSEKSESKKSGETVEIAIGIGAPLTQGATALGQGMKRGALLAIEQANESDEAKELGIKFVGVDGDDMGDPKTGVTVANTFAGNTKLVGVMGHLNSGVSIPASKVYNDKKIVQVSPASTNPALTLQGLDNVFRTCTIDSVQGPVGAQVAYGEFGFKTVAIVDDSTPYGTGLADEFGKEFEKQGGKIVFREKTTDKETDFNALATKIKNAKVDFVYYGGVYNAGALLSKQISDAGITAPMMGGDGLLDAEFINLAGAAQAEGDYTTCVGYPTDQLPAGQDFIAAFKEMWPDDELAAYDPYAYDAADVIIKAVFAVAEDMGADKVLSDAGRDAVIKTVAATDYDGVTGKIAFDENGDTLNKAITTYQVKGGKWVPVVLPKE